MSSDFHRDLADFIKTDLNALKEQGLISNEEYSEIDRIIENFAPHLLPDLIAKHRNFHQNRHSPFLEKDLLGVVTLEDVQKSGLSTHVLPKILRGLPRFYDRSNPSKFYLKSHFRNIYALKKHCIDKAVLSTYEDTVIPEDFSVCIFTWVMNDGLGDFYAQQEAAKILKDKFPQLQITLLGLLHKGVQKPKDLPFPCHYIYYENDADLTLELLDEEFLAKMRSSSLILQMPTFFPDTARLLQKIQEMEGSLPPPRYELLGEYGFVDSEWCHPETSYRSLGLHFLEKGILVKKIRVRDFSDLASLDNPDILQCLFGTKEPGKDDLAKYKMTRALNLGYFATPEGAYLYLHALLKKRAADTCALDLIGSNFGCLLEAMERYIQKEDAFPLLAQYGIKEVEILFEGSLCKISVGPVGKVLRLIQAKNLSPEDFETLLVLSSDFAACRGDRSFSEAVSAAKVFFYDAPYHARYFLKDLAAIAENRLGMHKGAAEYLRLFLHSIKPKVASEAEYVEEDYFHVDKPTLAEVGERMGELLADPETILGLHKLNRILYHEYAANGFLANLVARSLLIYQDPEIEKLEQSILHSFLREEIKFPEMIQQLQVLLSPYKKKVKASALPFWQRLEA